MKFKGTVIITDPCYIVKKLEECLKENSIDVKYPKCTNNIKEFEKSMGEIRKIISLYDDWKKCNYGYDMKVLGLHNYISESTICGDWSCTTYLIKNQKRTPKDIISEINNDNYINSNELMKLGEFCADSGLVGVFLLEEVLNYNPKFSQFIKNRSKCVTVIPDFEGDIQYYVDTIESAHIIGEGSINFFTI